MFVTFETNIYRRDCIFSGVNGGFISLRVSQQRINLKQVKKAKLSVWHLFLRSNRRREKQGRWSQICISSLDLALIHLLALTRHPRWANNTHKTRGSLKADNGNKRLRTKLPNFNEPLKLISSSKPRFILISHLHTCSQIAPVMVTGKGLTLPRPRFSLFLWLLKSFSSRFSSSSRLLQYRTCATRAQVSGVT